MNYTIIERQAAPARSPERSKRRIEGMDELVASLAPGNVARIEPGENEKTRAITDQVFRTATQAGKMVDVWEVGGILYAEVVAASGA